MLTKALFNGKLIDIEDARKCEDGTIFSCPMCGGRVIAKTGQDKAHHFAHFRIQDCGATDEKVAVKFGNNPAQLSKKMKL